MAAGQRRRNSSSFDGGIVRENLDFSLGDIVPSHKDFGESLFFVVLLGVGLSWCTFFFC